MKNIVESEVAVKEELADEPKPLSLAWATEPGPLPWETSVKDGLGNLVATCPRPDLAEYIRDTGNHFGECRSGLADARDVLVDVLKGRASMDSVVKMIITLEKTITHAGGSY